MRHLAAAAVLLLESVAFVMKRGTVVTEQGSR
jgi:hypothetical protein